MKLYNSSPDLSFCEELAEFIINKYQGVELKIILPNGFMCQELQKVLIHKQKTAILPEIIPFSGISPQGQSVWAKDNLPVISGLEEKLIIAKIINDYQQKSSSITQALELAPKIIELFSELERNNNSITILKDYHHSEYWQSIYIFLDYIFNERKIQLAKLEKQTLANAQRLNLETEINRVREKDANVIIAGIISTDKITANFLDKIKQIRSVYIIPPPASIPLGELNKEHISYLEFDDIYQEAEQISLISSKNLDKRIAIIIEDPKIKRIYCNFLLKYSLEFQDTIGDNLALTNISQMLIAISELLCDEFSLQKLFLILKNPLLNDNLVRKLELSLSGKNRFISSFQQMLEIIERKNNDELIEYCHKLADILSFQLSNDFNSTLKKIISSAEKLYPNIWYEAGAFELSKVLSDLIKTNIAFPFQIKDFSKILYNLISSNQYFPNKQPCNITIGTAEDLAMLKFDLVFLPQFNNNFWPPFSSVSPWLSKEAQEKLEFYSSEAKTNTLLYYFNLFLQKKEVIITRSIKYEGKTTLPSNFLLKLQAIFGEDIAKSVLQENNSTDFKIKNKLEGAYSNNFPNILSVTDIEMLIRSPYAFYAKKILNLRKHDTIWTEPKVSEFGSFLHKVLDKYSKSYEEFKNIKNKAFHFLNMGNEILSNLILPKYTKKIWQTKLIPISEAFIEFDEERRKKASFVYSEMQGEITMNINNHSLQIIGVADRIEVDHLGNLTILDYKTGSVPTKKDINSGLSPQLIIEALMAMQSGFNLNTSISNIMSLIYVKISSSKPYIQTTEVELTRQDLKHHQDGLTALLTHYITNKFFPYIPDLLTFNDYIHLSRKID